MATNFDASTNGRPDGRPHHRRTVLITGGAGFIGTHLARELVDSGYQVRILDALLEQVHGESPTWPDHLPGAVDRFHAYVQDRGRLREALEGVDAVVHLAARVGVGQSMYRMADYVDGNDLATAVLLEELVDRDLDRLLVASSMSVYGEGAYEDGTGRPVAAARRSQRQLERGRWEALGSRGEALQPVPTGESKQPDLSSLYALTKFDQERLCLIVGEAYGIPTMALRLFNVYGRHQALSNPYTGVLAIFASRLLNGHRPLVYEDGLQRRDFVHVTDVARAFRLALEGPAPEADDRVLNIGSGSAHSIREVGERMAEAMGLPELQPEITGRFRRGDIRHCFGDVTRARRVLDYRPRVAFGEGVDDLAEWLRDQEARDDVSRANRELEERGLVV